MALIFYASFQQNPRLSTPTESPLLSISSFSLFLWYYLKMHHGTPYHAHCPIRYIVRLCTLSFHTHFPIMHIVLFCTLSYYVHCPIMYMVLPCTLSYSVQCPIMNIVPFCKLSYHAQYPTLHIELLCILTVHTVLQCTLSYHSHVYYSHYHLLSNNAPTLLYLGHCPVLHTLYYFALCPTSTLSYLNIVAPEYVLPG